ncbi:unnamed protein product [Closterium sp. NIES-53]
MLNRRGLTGAQLLLALAATKASTLRCCTSTSTTSSATSTTAAAASTSSATAATTSTAATDAPTPGTTPTTTSTSSAASTSSTASPPAAPSTTLAPLAPAGAASFTRGRRSADLLSANELDPYWATRGTSWGGPPLPDQYAPDTPENVQEESEEEVTYEYLSKAADLPVPTEEAPPPEQGPQLISVTGDEFLYHRVPMEGLPASEWPEAASFPQPLVTGDDVHSVDTDDVVNLPKTVLEHLSVRAFAADADAAADKGPEKEQNDAAERNKTLSRMESLTKKLCSFLEEALSQQNRLTRHVPCA